jgi:hypothetical protein
VGVGDRGPGHAVRCGAVTKKGVALPGERLCTHATQIPVPARPTTYEERAFPCFTHMAGLSQSGH